MEHGYAGRPMTAREQASEHAARRYTNEAAEGRRSTMPKGMFYTRPERRWENHTSHPGRRSNDDKPNIMCCDTAPAPALTRTDRFNDALRKVTEDRGAVYGHPAVDFARANAIKTVLADCSNAEVRHALEMIAVKLARLVQTPDHLDSLIDIAGYARTAAMVLDRQAGQ